jgi:hypothetical protein
MCACMHRTSAAALGTIAGGVCLMSEPAEHSGNCPEPKTHSRISHPGNTVDASRVQAITRHEPCSMRTHCRSAAGTSEITMLVLPRCDGGIVEDGKTAMKTSTNWGLETRVSEHENPDQSGSLTGAGSSQREEDRSCSGRDGQEQHGKGRRAWDMGTLGWDQTSRPSPTPPTVSAS